MKYRILTIMLIMLLALSLFSGCASPPSDAVLATVAPTEEVSVSLPPSTPDPTRKINEESARIYSIDPNAPVVDISEETVPLASAPDGETLTKRDAEAIALAYAGLDTNQISFLYTKQDSDQGFPQYEVNFREGNYEYEIMVHAETGEVLEFEKDDIRD